MIRACDFYRGDYIARRFARALMANQRLHLTRQHDILKKFFGRAEERAATQ
jgi:hypothetical protein